MVRFLLIGLVVTGLAACGVKPSAPDSPDPESRFPHTYPDISTDTADTAAKIHHERPDNQE